MIFDPGSPLEAIRLQFPHARVDFDDGSSPARAAEAAAKADAVVLFVDQYMTESADAQSLNLPGRQDRLVEAVTRANPSHSGRARNGRTGAHALARTTAAVLEAWYPGQKGGEAIAEILSGAADPSGRLPVTFPVSEDQLPHPKIQGDPNGAPIGPVGRGGHYGAMFTAVYNEGASVGYKVVLRARPAAFVSIRLRAFLHQLRFEQARRERQRPLGHSQRDRAKFWERAGAAIPQFYLSGPDGANIPLRLVGWDQNSTSSQAKSGQSTVSIDPRLLATFDEGARRWRIRPGAYQLTAGFDSQQRELAASFELQSASLPP